MRTKLSAIYVFVLVAKEIPDGETYSVTSCHKIRIRKNFLTSFTFSAGIVDCDIEVFSLKK